MRIILILLRKEFKQIFRNKIIIAMAVAVPVLQLAVLPFAADYEIKNINIAIVDHDHSPYSRQLISKIPSSGYFRLVGYLPSYQEALQLVEANKADLVLEIPPDFERNLIREKHQKIFIAANAINEITSGLGTNYLRNIIRNFNADIKIHLLNSKEISTSNGIQITFSNWFNPDLNYKVLMVPGILAMLVMMIGGFLSTLNFVREKEVGTMEQINVTPIKKYHFVIGKLVPFWILGMVAFTLGLLISRLIYGIIPEGSILLLYGFTSVFLVLVLGLGFLVSTFCQTQQQAMLIMFFFMMVFILMSGLFTPADIMPQWAKIFAFFNPLSYLIQVMRMVILKGSGFKDVLTQFELITGYAILLNGLAILNYKKTT